MSKYHSHIVCTPSTDDWIPSYLETIPGLVQKHGGTYIYRATDFEPVEMPADMPTPFVVLIEWPDAAAAAAMYADPDYQSIKQARIAGSETQWFNAPAYED